MKISSWVGASMAVSAVLSLGFSGAAVAAASAPNALRPLLQCRNIPDIPTRVACYDRQADLLTQATDKQDIIVVDRDDVQKARRSVFGLTLPSLSFLDRDTKGKPEELTQIEGKITSASSGATGKWRYTLDDGSRWIQLESHDFVRDPRAGMPIRIRKAAAGSFLANVDGQTAVRIERER